MKQVLKSIIDKHMIERGDRVVAGVSGGADSVCLFFLLLELKKKIEFEFMVVHVNHQIRGEEALEDQRYVEKICAENHVPIKIVTKNVQDVAKKEKFSEEEAGRMVRYRVFEQVLKEWKGNKIALAHHKNDQAETVLWNLVRGSGLKGMTGMRQQRECFIRPLLSVTRKEIEVYLEERNISYQTDSTNETLDYTRNKIRLRVLPYLADELNGKAVEHIANTAEIFQELQDFIERTVEQVWDMIVKKQGEGYLLETKAFLAQDIVIQKAILQKVLVFCANGLKDITSEHILILQKLFLKEVGKHVQLPRNVAAVKNYDGVVISSATEAAGKLSEKIFAVSEQAEISLAIPGTIEMGKDNIKVECSIMNRSVFDKIVSKMERDSKKSIINSKNYCTKWFDYDKISSTVSLRNQKNGDVLQIGKNGEHKKLNRFFIDQKIPREERGAIWILAEGQEVIWVINHRISEGYRVVDTTENILQVTVKFTDCHDCEKKAVYDTEENYNEEMMKLGNKDTHFSEESREKDF